MKIKLNLWNDELRREFEDIIRTLEMKDETIRIIMIGIGIISAVSIGIGVVLSLGSGYGWFSILQGEVGQRIVTGMLCIIIALIILIGITTGKVKELLKERNQKVEKFT